MLDENNYKIDEDNSLLILDDDQPFLKRLSAAMEKRGFDVFPVSSMVEFDGIIKTVCPNYAIVDLRLNDGTGLDAVESIRKKKSRRKSNCSHRLWCNSYSCSSCENWSDRLFVKASRCK